MHTQPTPSLTPWPEEARASNGVVVAGGYGLKVRVWRGRLHVDDGAGPSRRSRLFHRATSGLKRLVVLGHTGYVSLEAFPWLADIKAAYLQIDADGRVLATFGPPGTDRPGLRRAQAIATQGDQALVLSRWLVDAKLRAQHATLMGVSPLVPVDEGLRAIAEFQEALTTAGSIEELRAAEAWAAGAYWQALAPIEVRFARRDADRVPGHWRTFGGRSSPIANGPRVAANPANAVLNYLYALLEAEATLATRVIGLDPGLGVMHADQGHRDSLAADLMEPIRPLVDAYAVRLLTSRPLAARDFFETSVGACRVTAPLTHELAETSRHWGRLVGKVAEDLATALEGSRTRSSGTPTPISGRRRAAGRPAGPAPTRKASPAKRRACSWCGSTTLPGRQTCSSECADRVLGQTHEQFAIRSSERMRRFAGRSDHPGLTPEANRKRSEKRRAQRAEELAWDRGSADQGNGVKVGVVEYKMVSATGDLYGKVAGWYNAATNLPGSDPDCYGSNHPTWVAGAVASQNATYRGVAPGAVILSAATCQPDGDPNDHDVIEAADWALQQGADILNLSLVQDGPVGLEAARKYFDSVIDEQLDNVIAATGNLLDCGTDSATTNEEVGSPGVGWNVLTVGGIYDQGTTSHSDDRLWYDPANTSGACWADNPPTPWNNGTDPDFNKPEVSAPAYLIRTANGINDSGTSVATPMVAGIAAQLIARSATAKVNPNLTKALIMAGAVFGAPLLPQYGGGFSTDHQGVGIVSAKWANNALISEGGTTGGYHTGTFTSVTSYTKTFSVTAGQYSQVAVVWNTQTSGSSKWAKVDAYTTDLDMVVTLPGGTQKISDSAWNGWEYVDFTAPSAGTVTVRVTVYRLDTASQGFALAWIKGTTPL